MSTTTTWIRIEDEFSQFDHPKDLPLPPKTRRVPNFPEHHGVWARESTPRKDKGGTPIGEEKLTGQALEQALKDRQLPSEGTADEKRDLVAKYDLDNAPAQQ